MMITPIAQESGSWFVDLKCQMVSQTHILFKISIISLNDMSVTRLKMTCQSLTMRVKTHRCWQILRADAGSISRSPRNPSWEASRWCTPSPHHLGNGSLRGPRSSTRWGKLKSWLLTMGYTWLYHGLSILIPKTSDWRMEHLLHTVASNIVVVSCGHQSQTAVEPGTTPFSHPESDNNIQLTT